MPEKPQVPEPESEPALLEYRDYFLTKKGMTEKIKFEVTEIDSLLVSSCGHVMLIVEEVTTAVFSLSDALVLINEIPDQLKELVLRVGDNRGHVVAKASCLSE